MQVKKKKKKNRGTKQTKKKKKRLAHDKESKRSLYLHRKAKNDDNEREQEPLPINDWKRAERRLRFTLAFTTVERLVLVISLAEIEKEAKSAS